MADHTIKLYKTGPIPPSQPCDPGDQIFFQNAETNVSLYIVFPPPPCFTPPASSQVIHPITSIGPFNVARGKKRSPYIYAWIGMEMGEEIADGTQSGTIDVS